MITYFMVALGCKIGDLVEKGLDALLGLNK